MSVARRSESTASRSWVTTASPALRRCCCWRWCRRVAPRRAPESIRGRSTPRRCPVPCPRPVRTARSPRRAIGIGAARACAISCCCSERGSKPEISWPGLRSADHVASAHQTNATDAINPPATRPRRFQFGVGLAGSVLRPSSIARSAGRRPDGVALFQLVIVDVVDVADGVFALESRRANAAGNVRSSSSSASWSGFIADHRSCSRNGRVRARRRRARSPPRSDRRAGVPTRAIGGTPRSARRRRRRTPPPATPTPAPRRRSTSAPATPRRCSG